MKRLWFAIAFMLLAFPAFASLGYNQVTALSATTASALPNIPSNPPAGSFILSVEAQAIRYRDDNVAPTSTVGQPVAVGQTVCISSDPKAVQIISQVAGATANITYYAGKNCS